MSSQAQGAVGAGNTDAIAWLAKRLKAARSDSEAHPEGHSNRAFYDGQAIAYENVLSLLEHEKPATPRTDSAEVTAGAATKWTVPRAVLVEAVAQHFHNEEHQHEGYAWVWPEYADDDGRRGNSGYVSITPPVVQLECREAAERLVRLFEGYVATPAPSSPGVPDSVRALSEDYARKIDARRAASRAYNDAYDAILKTGRSPKFDELLAERNASQKAEQERDAAEAALLAACLYISAHPAGQSTGQGADGWLPIETAPKDGTRIDLWVVPHDAFANGNADRLEARWMERVGWVRLGGGYVSECGAPTHWRPRPGAPGIPAPDSPLTGPVGVEELRAAMIRALDGHTTYSRDCHLSGDFLCQQVWPLVEAALAARPAAPEAQGAWSFDMEAAPRDGTPVIVAAESHHKDGEPIVGEAYIDADNGGHWWWAGESYGGYHAAPLHEVGNPPYAWHPMLDAPAPPSSGQGGR